MVNEHSQKYQNQQILSASPAMLVAMLYDKAISSLQEAIRAIEQDQIEERWKANARAMEIINHMLITLDMEQGGQIAANLEQLFTFILSRLPDVDVNNDPKAAKDVISLLRPLAQSWHALAKQEKGGGETPAPEGQQAEFDGDEEGEGLSPGTSISA